MAVGDLVNGMIKRTNNGIDYYRPASGVEVIIMYMAVQVTNSSSAKIQLFESASSGSILISETGSASVLTNQIADRIPINSDIHLRFSSTVGTGSNDYARYYYSGIQTK